MLTAQIEFSKACAELYKPISGRASDPDSFIPEGNPEGIQAAEEYEAIVHELQETLKPELEMIEARVIKPADELLEVLKVIRKLLGKRDHKQLDYDRHRATLKKLQDKKDKTLKDEKALYKAESDVEMATQDYNHFNELLKEELPQLFAWEREFIRPLFQSFYYMQLNVFYTLHERMQSIDIGYFDLTLDIEAAFAKKRGDVQEETEKLSIVHYKATGGRTKGISKYGDKARSALSDRKTPSSISTGRRSTMDSSDTPPPPYSADASTSHFPEKSPSALSGTGIGIVGRSNSAGSSFAAAAKAKGAAPPPPKPKPGRLSGVPAAETVTALYDYEAQAEGDLSFSTGDVIEIVTRTQNENEWWTGKIGIRQGQFPGMKFECTSAINANRSS